MFSQPHLYHLKLTLLLLHQALSKRLRHRGPDWSGTKMTDDSILVHERLAIVGVGA